METITPEVNVNPQQKIPFIVIFMFVTIVIMGLVIAFNVLNRSQCDKSYQMGFDEGYIKSYTDTYNKTYTDGYQRGYNDTYENNWYLKFKNNKTLFLEFENNSQYYYSFTQRDNTTFYARGTWLCNEMVCIVIMDQSQWWNTTKTTTTTLPCAEDVCPAKPPQ